MCFDSFKKYWLDIYKRQVFKAILLNDTEALLEIKENIWKNLHLTKENKKEFLWKVGIRI